MYLRAYGSLVADLRGNHILPRKVRGLRRDWGVAMDNRLDIPGYKMYVAARTGERHDGHVAFLDLVEEPAAELEGLLFEVDGDDLDHLDVRERNYSRVDVSSNVIDPPGLVFAYIGTEDGRTRFAKGSTAGDLIISKTYLDAVSTASVDHRALPCPVADLTRIDL